MPIRPALIEKIGRKHVLVLTGEQTIADAVAKLKQKGGAENETYAVVRVDDAGYAVASMPELAEILARLGPEALTAPLRTLPLKPAYQVIPVDTGRAGAQVKEEVDNKPGRAFVIVDQNGFVALFLNVNLSGLDIAVGSLMRLHGDMVQPDGRVKVSPSVPKPVCPHCSNQDFYKFQQGVYTCRSCGKVINP